MYSTKVFIFSLLSFFAGITGVILMMTGMTSTQALPLALGGTLAVALVLFVLAHAARFTIHRVRGI